MFRRNRKQKRKKKKKQQLCKNCQEFYGQPQQNNLCSQCFKKQKESLPDKKGIQIMEKCFFEYADKGGDRITGGGIQRLCKDLGISVLDPITLVLSYHFKAIKMGRWTKEEFLGGLQTLYAKNIKDLRDQIPQMRQNYESNDEYFRKIYMFTFDFAKENEIKKNLKYKSARALWSIFMKRMEKKYKGEINGKTWNEYLDVITLFSKVKIKSNAKRKMTFQRIIGKWLSNFSQKQNVLQKAFKMKVLYLLLIIQRVLACFY